MNTLIATIRAHDAAGGNMLDDTGVSLAADLWNAVIDGTIGDTTALHSALTKATEMLSHVCDCGECAGCLETSRLIATLKEHTP